jgi:L-iditol 2-dehydrogenase
MRAAVLYGKEEVRIEEVTSRDLGPGEVRVRIHAALTCGTDLKVFKRGYHAKMIVPPAVFGHELAGVIQEIHPSVRDWNCGERVVVANSAPCGACCYCLNSQENLCDDLLFLNGAYAQEIVVPARLVEKNMLRLAPETSFRDAALTEPLACVVQGVDELKPKAGQSVLVIGSGPIGLMFVTLCKHEGCEVSLAGRGKERLAVAQKLGAAQVIDLANAADLTGAVRSSPGGPYDVVIEAVGKTETWESAVLLVRKGGKVNFFGGCPSGTRVSLDTGLIHYSNLTLLASFHHTPRSIRKALGFIESGIVSSRDFVGGNCRLTDLPALLHSMAQGNRAVKTFVNVEA